MSEPDETIIGGIKTCEDWRVFRANLIPGRDPTSWETAFSEFFRPRLQTRYLGPIETLQRHDTNQGEGFSIVTILCTLIEFLESTVQGKKYRWVAKDSELGPNEYRNSGQVFVDFLTNRQPFRQCFTDVNLAWEFYKNVRCSLLHEARTKGGWRIRACGPPKTIADTNLRILYRNTFHVAILEFVEWYGLALISDVNFQNAFTRKFNDLCE